MMTKNGYVILETTQYDDITVAILKRNTNFQPFVVAWSYHEDTDTWEQGHYFSELSHAVNYFEDEYKSRNLREKVYKAMSSELGVMAEYGDDEKALHDEVYGCNLEILKMYAETFLWN
jgi:hypothetical protein